ncbi:MAG TPA: acetyl-CoA hydrolase/transferase C-terminal domain-containing protein [Candidatus Acidoferrales bacterium]|nr:acetyl-CoA hydrolase/transferase C-terminal domain-containing protein [Candidatus Acidoferrales bacterium]
MSWVDTYRSRVTTAEEAVKVIKSGDKIHLHPGCAVPEILVDAMVARAPELCDCEIIHVLTVGKAKYTEPGMANHFRHTALFLGKNVRDAVNEGRADFVPIFLSEIPGLFYSGEIKIDVALIHVSPPDEHGFCSFGVGVDITKAATDVAKVVIAQVNHSMPRALGDSFIHISKVHKVVEVDAPIMELPQVEPDATGDEIDVYRKIGENISGLIEDGSTLQLGIGKIPDAVLMSLEGKKDLGVHSEMFSDGIIKLVENGIITNERKSLHPGKMVAGFVLGSKRLFDFIHNNPIAEFHPTHYVNDPFIISQNKKMVAINSAIQIDLTGQVCADSMGYNFYSGFGGQVDFIRGAARSEGGKPIVALPSTAKSGTVSRIATHLAEGAGVTTSRGDVHYVATEFGVVNLHGKKISERTKALIDIAHPKFRDELTCFAKEKRWM